MKSLVLQADRVLRGTPLVLPSAPASRLFMQLVTFIVLSGFFYGGMMGTFGGVAGERIGQVVYSAAKVPLLLLATFIITLPSFFVLNTLLGVRGDFSEVLRALVATQAGLAIILAALAPYTTLWYASSENYPAAVFFNGLMFAVASGAAQWLLRRYYAPLIARNPRHRLLLRGWLILYVFVGIQMGWVLRPFIGAPGMPTQFFRDDSWGNAYVVVAKLIWEMLEL